MRAEIPVLRDLLDGQRPVLGTEGYQSDRVSVPRVDATLGLPGLPQSATGQTTLLTGINAATHLGEHSGPYPNTALRKLLRRGTLFQRLLAGGQPVAFANAYPDRFLDRIPRGKARLSANTRAALEAGLKLRGPTDLQAGRGISALLTNEYWSTWGYSVPELTTPEAGAQLVSLAQDHRLTYFEFWYSDLVGHKQDRQAALDVLQRLDGFLAGILATLDLSRSLLLIISDHGNFEDWTTSKHTTNPALALVAGIGHRAVAARLKSLVDVTPVLLEALRPPGAKPPG
jgi:2,3-bisphosphoglycerate-independent phosphoglycerate mutase